MLFKEVKGYGIRTFTSEQLIRNRQLSISSNKHDKKIVKCIVSIRLFNKAKK
jgi:hypothetical protein